MQKKNKIFGWVITIVMLIVGLLCIYPFIFMVSSSFKVSGDVLQKPFQIIPDPATLENIKGLFRSDYYNFPKWYLNTVLMTGITIIIKLFLITYTAYGYSKMKFKGRDAIFLVLLAAMVIPADIMILPRYMIFKNLKLLNSMWAIIIPSCVDVYFVFLFCQRFFIENATSSGVKG